MIHVKGDVIEKEFKILHGKSGYYYVPYHVEHSEKINHKLHISAVIGDNDDDYDILLHILNEDQFSDSIPVMLQDAEGDEQEDFHVKYSVEQSKNPKYTMDIKKSQIWFILFDNEYAVINDKIIKLEIQEEWDEEETKTKNSAFVIMPMGNSDGDEVYRAIKSECGKVGLNATRVDEVAGSRLISADIITQIKKSEFIIVDLTNERPNVYYELGYAHGIGAEGNNILLIAKKGTKLHFDISGLRVREYESIMDLRDIVYDDLKMMVSNNS